MYALESDDHVVYVSPLDPAIAWPDDQKKADALDDKYQETLDVGLLKYSGTPIRWLLRPLTPLQLSWTFEQSCSEVTLAEWYFHLALAGVVGVDDAPDGMPALTYRNDGKRIRYVDPRFWDAIGAPMDYVYLLGKAVLRISKRDTEAEKNSFCLSVHRRSKSGS